MNSATKERFIKAGISSEEKMEKRVHEEIQLSVVSDNRLDMKLIRVQFEDKEIVFRFNEKKQDSRNMPRIIEVCEEIIEISLSSRDEFSVYILNFKTMKANCTCFEVKDHSFFCKSGKMAFINEVGEVVNTPFTNEEIAKEFWMQFFNEHDETAAEKYLSEPYLQHNPSLGDGVEELTRDSMSVSD